MTRPLARAIVFVARRDQTGRTRNRCVQCVSVRARGLGSCVGRRPQARFLSMRSRGRLPEGRALRARARGSRRNRDPQTFGDASGASLALRHRRKQAPARSGSPRPSPGHGAATRTAQAAERWCSSIQISTKRLMFGGTVTRGSKRSNVSGGNFLSSRHSAPFSTVSRIGANNSAGPSMSSIRLPRSHVQIRALRATKGA